MQIDPARLTYQVFWLLTIGFILEVCKLILRFR